MANPPGASRLWDGPTRIVHWALVALVAFSWWAGDEGHMEWHRWSGYGVIGLVAFRLIWGVAGSQTARFASFVKGPATTIAYMSTLPQRTDSEVPGHNPVGAWSVVAILLLLVIQTATGLYSVDVDGLESGPLSDRVSFETGRLAAKLHHWSFWALEVLIALHVAAVVFHALYKRTNLIGPMITGRRRFARPADLAFAPLWRILVAAVFAAAFAWWASKGFRL